MVISVNIFEERSDGLTGPVKNFFYRKLFLLYIIMYIVFLQVSWRQNAKYPMMFEIVFELKKILERSLLYVF